MNPSSDLLLLGYFSLPQSAMLPRSSFVDPASGVNGPARAGRPLHNPTSLGDRARKKRRGMTIVETIIALTLVLLLVAGAQSVTITMLRTARRQGVYNSALALVENKNEWFRTQAYAPPASPFLASTNTIVDTVPVTLSDSGTSVTVTVTVTSTVSVVSSGHLVKIVATYTYLNKPVTITTQTVINAYSGANRTLS